MTTKKASSAAVNNGEQRDWCRRAADILRNLNLYKNAVAMDYAEDEEAESRLRQTKRLLLAVEQALSMLTDEERFFLEKMYIHAGERPVDDICAQCCMEKSNVYRLRRRALEKFTMAIYGRY